MTSRKQNFKFQCGEFFNPRNVLLKAETCRYPPNVFSSTLTGEGGESNFVNMLIKYQSYYTKSYQNLSVLKFLKMRVSTEKYESTRS